MHWCACGRMKTKDVTRKCFLCRRKGMSIREVEERNVPEMVASPPKPQASTVLFGDEPEMPHGRPEGIAPLRSRSISRADWNVLRLEHAASAKLSGRSITVDGLDWLPVRKVGEGEYLAINTDNGGKVQRVVKRDEIVRWNRA